MIYLYHVEYEIKLINERLEEEKKEKQKQKKKRICTVKESIQDVFSLDETEVERKMEKYWVQPSE